jgi:hypothetical protein
MRKSVQEYIKNCVVCQKTKSDTLAPAGLLQPLPIPCQVWEDITLDFIERLPASQGQDTIMVVVDRLSKSAHFLPLKHPFTTKSVAEKFVAGVIELHGMPRTIVSDQDPVFVSHFWQEFFKMSGICDVLFTNGQQNGASTYHGQNIGIIQHTTSQPE